MPAHRRRFCRESHRPGFTLIEILVVVAIIALLISVLLPSLSRARDQAKTAVCGANLRTTGQAAAYYMQANRDYLPQSGGWAERVHTYVQKLSMTKFTGQEATTNGGVDMSVAFYNCPADVLRASTSQVNRLINGKVVATNYLVSYTINGFCIWPLIDEQRARAWKDYKTDFVLNQQTAPKKDPLGNPIYTPLRCSTSWKRTSALILFADAGNDDLGGAIGGTANVPEINWDFDDEEDLSGPVLEVHHRVGNNFLYADQHIGFSKVTSRAKNWATDVSIAPGSYGVPSFPYHWVPIDFSR